ncbi:putative DNA RNA polymerase [Lyophyllum shimeji]|uniref:RNA-directed DNA polymerase n=1 Tax=Lyophyllum shimeji TaxID=47721 RepID=A0A9P3UMV8_LYOSH|nr:putative DNA RNA polymerase [Lyophyllum shimeji]
MTNPTTPGAIPGSYQHYEDAQLAYPPGEHPQQRADASTQPGGQSPPPDHMRRIGPGRTRTVPSTPTPIAAFDEAQRSDRPAVIVAPTARRPEVNPGTYAFGSVHQEPVLAAGVDPDDNSSTDEGGLVAASLAQLRIEQYWNTTDVTSERRRKKLEASAEQVIFEADGRNREDYEPMRYVNRMLEVLPVVLREYRRNHLKGAPSSTASSRVGTPMRGSTPHHAGRARQAPVTPQVVAEENNQPVDERAVAVASLHQARYSGESTADYMRRQAAAQRVSNISAAAAPRNDKRSDPSYEPPTIKQEERPHSAADSGPRIQIPPRIPPGHDRVPLAEKWDDRVAYQRMREADLQSGRHSRYDDQFVVFEGHQPVDTLPQQAGTEGMADGNPPSQVRVAAPTSPFQPRASTRGYSMPAPVLRDQSIAEGIKAAGEQHRSKMHNRIHELIVQRLSVRLSLPEGLKPHRADSKAVGTFRGSAKFSDLENWLTNLVVMMAASQYGGPERDIERVLMVNEFLDGEARKWYNRHVVSVNRTKGDWTFEEVILGLYDRFVHPSTMQDARDDFNAVRYSEDTGVQGLYDALVDHAQNMAVDTSNWTFLDKFVRALPQDIRKALFKEGLSPEINTAEEFLALGLAYEAAAKTAAYYERRAPATRAAAHQATSSPKEPTRNHGTKRFFVSKHDFQRGNYKGFTSPNTRRESVKKETRAEVKPPQQVRPQTSKQEYKPAPKGGDNAPRQHQSDNDDRCFRCGGRGHFSKNCPTAAKPQRAQVRAAHTAVPEEPNDADDELASGRNSGSEHGAHERPESEVGGSEDDDIIEVEVFDNDYESSDSDGEHMFAMTELPAHSDMHDGQGTVPVRSRRVVLKSGKDKMQRPIHGAAEKECLATYVFVGGHDAWTLWDSGSTTTGITPAFAQVADIKVFPLETPLILQLGTAGSRATVNYGTRAHMRAPGFDGKVYMDLANFDKYDMVIGTPFMRANNVVLDFGKNEVTVNGVATPATRVKLEDTDGAETPGAAPSAASEAFPVAHEQHRRGRRPFVEDEDEEVLQAVNLPTDHPAILLSEEEFQETLKGGGTPPPDTTKRKFRAQEPATKRDRAQEPATQRETRAHEPEREAKAQTEEPKREIKAQVEERNKEVAHDDILDKTQPSYSREYSFWDRPDPPPQYEWMYDPRMPVEWNATVAAMRAYEGRNVRPQEVEQYREAHPDEVSEVMELDLPKRKRPYRRPQYRLPVRDKSEFNLVKLRARFDVPRSHFEAADMRAAYAQDKAQGRLTPADYPRLRQQWHDEFEDMVGGTKPVLPPWREVNHEINLIDEDKQYQYHAPRCPMSLRDEFYAKINKYVDAKWWEPRSVKQAAPLLCIPKKDGSLRTPLDARQRNNNTIKDVTPLPDQEIIREDVARAKIRSKIDLTDAYEQVRVRTEDVHKTAFTTIAETYVSNIMQIRDCNAPATFQRLMTSIFRDAIGKFMHVYLDDIFIFSETIEEHEQHLRVVFERLREHSLYLKWKKCELYADRVDCLGHIINDQGIHPDADKLARIRDWRTPRNYNDIQRFVGLVNYLGHFLPDITAYTGPLMAMTQNGAPFYWRPIHQRCFDMIKRICCKTPIIKPIEPKTGEPIWLICDASKSGVGAMYGQGPTWAQCRPAGFMSKKFTNAQQNYAVHELETLAILEALMKWEDKLVGYKIHVITDHKALEFFKTQSNMTPRQRRWMEYMSKFNFDITYVKGDLNKVADCLSRYYESDTAQDVHNVYDYVNVDARIDPTGEDLPAHHYQEVVERTVEVRAMQETTLRRSQRIQERREEREIEAQIMQDAASNAADKSSTASQSSASAASNEDPQLGEALLGRATLDPPPDHDDAAFRRNIAQNYSEDKLFSIILEKPEDFRAFRAEHDLIWTTNAVDDSVLCVPRVPALITPILEQAHLMAGHFGAERTAEYVRRWYWWPTLAKDVRLFCKTCETCQRSKDSNQKPAGKLHSLPVPVKPWDSIGMDFIGPFPESKGFNYLWVVICQMTSMVHLIPVHTNMTASQLSWIYLREIVRLHGLPSSIVSDRDSKFTSRWWRTLHKLLGAKLLMSTSFHPQTDGQTERANRSIGQIFRSVVRHDQKDWVERVPMTEFAINVSVSGTTKFAPFELNGGYMPSMLKEIRSDSVIPRGIKAYAERALLNLAEAHDAIIESRVFQTHRANQRRSADPDIKGGDLVYLSTKNLNLPKGRARKLCPRFVGPYKVLRAMPETSIYTLELPTALQERHINPTFHVSLLRPYHAASDTMFPNRAQPEPYDFGAPDDHEWFVDEILGHRWTQDKKLEYEVRWSLGDTTWEPHDNCKQLAALDRYLELQGVKRPSQLPKRV